MNQIEETLVILMEECSEAAVEASKIIRFEKGFDRLEAELGDVLCMINILERKGYIKRDNLELYAQAKEIKLKQWSNLDISI